MDTLDGERDGFGWWSGSNPMSENSMTEEEDLIEASMLKHKGRGSN